MDEIDQLREDIIKSETFCFYPFTQLSSNPSGHLKPCCNYVGPMTHPDGSVISILSGDNFTNAWNSEHLVDLREKLHKGDIPDACRRCIRDGDVSMRKRSVDDYKIDRKTLELVVDSIKNNYQADHHPSYLELKPSNLCKAILPSLSKVNFNRKQLIVKQHSTSVRTNRPDKWFQSAFGLFWFEVQLFF